MASSHLPYLILVPLAVLAAAAVASYHSTPASSPAHHHHHRSPSTTTAITRFDSAPSKRPNYYELKASQKQIVPYLHTTRVEEWSASEVPASPPVDDPAATATALQLPDPYHAEASPPLPLRAGPAGLVAWGGDHVLAMVLASLGYKEMGSAAALLADSPSAKRWPGSITIFAAPDIFLQACRAPWCSRRHLLLQHMALGYFPYSDLAAALTVRIPSATVGFCLNITAARTPFTVHDITLYVDGVEVSQPDLYNDGHYVVHGIYGVIPPLSPSSCFDGLARHRHHFSAISAATSSAAAASFVRIMILEAISRLQDGGYGFVALAMRVDLIKLEKLVNLTVFALSDHSIFTAGGHDYVPLVRSHIVPGHRLTRADLLRLRTGAVLPTLAGEDHKLVITTGAGSASDEIRINYMPLKDPDVVITSHVAVHGIYVSFPRLHLVDLAASSIQMHGICRDGHCTSASITRSAQDHGDELVAASLPPPVLSGVAQLEDSGDELEQQQLSNITGEAHDSKPDATEKAPRCQHGGFFHCIVSQFHYTGLTCWRMVAFTVKYCLRLSLFLVSMVASLMSALLVNLIVHLEMVIAGIALAAAIVFAMLLDAPRIGFLVDIPVDLNEFADFTCCGCHKRPTFRLSHLVQWFCPACLEVHIVSKHCVTEPGLAHSRKRFRILVFGEPHKVEDLDEYPGIQHIYTFPSWYISKVDKNWFHGEVAIEYASFDDILKLKKPRKQVIIYDTWPPHKILKGLEDSTY